jgi:hypothetical protein
MPPTMIASRSCFVDKYGQAQIILDFHDDRALGGLTSNSASRSEHGHSKVPMYFANDPARGRWGKIERVQDGAAATTSHMRLLHRP